MLEAPKIVVTPPGPKSKELLELRRDVVPEAVYLIAPIAIEEAKNAVIRDVDGNIYIDFTSGIGVTNVGHCPETVVEAIREQVGKLIHISVHVTSYPIYLDLAQKLVEITPGRSKKMVFFANSGAEAVENAVKISRQHTGRYGLITFENSFHGRTYMAMTLTGKWEPYKMGFAPYVPGVFIIPFAYCYRCPFNLEYPTCGLHCIEYIKKFVFKTHVPPDDVAAIIAEPIQGEGGFVTPPMEYFRELKKICDEHGILLVIDEVQTGFARTGKMFAIEHWGVEPDLMTLAKSMAAGMPLSAVVGKNEIMRGVKVGSIGGTYGGNPVSCAAALKAIETFQKEKLDERAEKLGKEVRKRLEEMGERFEIIGDVRGKGLMQAIELVQDRKTKEPATEETKKVLKIALTKGLLILRAGLLGNVVRFHPPLTIEEELLDRGVQIVEESLKESQK